MQHDRMCVLKNLVKIILENASAVVLIWVMI